VDHYEPGRLVSLGITFTISLVLVLGFVLLSLSVVNVALAVDMPDAPVTQDTVTAGNDGNDDSEDDEGNEQNDDDQEDAPVTDALNAGGDSDNDEDNNANNDDDGEPTSKDAPLPHPFFNFV
jgi:hypothetical protein